MINTNALERNREEIESVWCELCIILPLFLRSEDLLSHAYLGKSRHVCLSFAWDLSTADTNRLIIL